MARDKDRLAASPDLALHQPEAGPAPPTAAPTAPKAVDRSFTPAARRDDDGPRSGAPPPRPSSRSVAPPPSRRSAVVAKPKPRPRRVDADAEPRSRPSTRLRPSSPPRARVLAPEEYLSRAMEAKTPRSRGIWARRGLASRTRLDRTTQAMLLRQLYLSHFEQRHFREAFAISEQSLDLGVLEDVLHQDAARAAAAMGDLDLAARHLRLAARTGPPSRRAFHWWTLGSLFFLAGRLDDAIGALERAARWGTRDKPLYQGHLAVARCARGLEVPELREVRERLASVPAGQGYGRFVLGLLAFHAGRHAEAKAHLDAFVQRTEAGRAATSIALDGELARARRTLRAISRARR